VKDFGNHGGSLVQLQAPSLFVGSPTGLHIAVEHSLL
jgi:hypothetical protein